MRAGRLGNVTGALLMGGASSRMGRDKAGLEWDGEPWGIRAARLLEGLFEEILLVGGDPAPDAPGRRVADPAGPRCALRGLVAALGAASSERVLVIATDLPLLSADLLLALTAWPEYDAVVPSDAQGDHPLCAIYRRDTVLPMARDRLACERLSLKGLLERIDTARVTLAEFGLGDLGSQPLTNVNTPDDLAGLAARVEH
ncbi:MAG: molybdenum cofactor guanylyltransferase [bacterium]|nr:hypothetical protein [Deltaproteobacteria bacterium]MCP4908477.1 molybdenum cofactor guanylyltransferase [bacterium]